MTTQKGQGVRNFRGSMRGNSNSNEDLDDNEWDGITIPNWIEFGDNIRKDFKKMDIDQLWKVLHILIAEINNRWNLVAINNRMRNKK